MTSIHIDERLKCISSMCEPCQCAIDVGCDHGYLAIDLVLNKKAHYVVASDIANGPLNAAKKNIEKVNLTDYISTLLCNGIPNEIKADIIIIAGMGGLLICDILRNNQNSCKKFILQANNNLPSLRKFLNNNHYKIIDENVCKVKDKYYEILKIVKGAQVLSENELEFGPINLTKKSPLFIEKYTSLLNHYLSIQSNFKGSNEQLQKIINEIQKIKNVVFK